MINYFERLIEDDIRYINEITRFILSSNKSERDKDVQIISKMYEKYGYSFFGLFLHHTMPIL